MNPLKVIPLIIAFSLLNSCASPIREPSSETNSNFLKLCTTLVQGQGKDPLFCSKIQSRFFSKTQPKDAVAMVQPADVGAPALNVDSTVNFVIFNDPNYLAGVSYCYFVFRGWIDPAKLSPDDEALNSSGFSILNEEISAYQNWLDKNETGKSCKARIEKDSGVPVANLKNLLGKHSALIGLNPLASVHTGHLSYSSVLDDLALTLNHERVHAYQVLCPDLEKWGQAQWNLLPQNEKDKFSVVYPAYNWKDLKIAGREYVAFSYEGKPTKLLERLNGCKIKP